MVIRTLEFNLAHPKAARIAAIGAEILAAKTNIPNIVMSMLVMIDQSPTFGEIRLYDKGFMTHWQHVGHGNISIEIIQDEFSD